MRNCLLGLSYKQQNASVRCKPSSCFHVHSHPPELLQTAVAGQGEALQPYSLSFASWSSPWCLDCCSGDSTAKQRHLVPPPASAWEGRLSRGDTHGLGGRNWSSCNAKMNSHWWQGSCWKQCPFLGWICTNTLGCFSRGATQLHRVQYFLDSVIFKIVNCLMHSNITCMSCKFSIK